LPIFAEAFAAQFPDACSKSGSRLGEVTFYSSSQKTDDCNTDEHLKRMNALAVCGELDVRGM
jgi:hypothetical protein